MQTTISDASSDGTFVTAQSISQADYDKLRSLHDKLQGLCLTRPDQYEHFHEVAVKVLHEHLSDETLVEMVMSEDPGGILDSTKLAEAESPSAELNVDTEVFTIRSGVAYPAIFPENFNEYGIPETRQFRPELLQALAHKTARFVARAKRVRSQLDGRGDNFDIQIEWQDALGDSIENIMKVVPSLQRRAGLLMTHISRLEEALDVVPSIRNALAREIPIAIGSIRACEEHLNQFVQHRSASGAGDDITDEITLETIRVELNGLMLRLQRTYHDSGVLVRIIEEWEGLKPTSDSD